MVFPSKTVSSAYRILDTPFHHLMLHWIWSPSTSCIVVCRIPISLTHVVILFNITCSDYYQHKRPMQRISFPSISVLRKMSISFACWTLYSVECLFTFYKAHKYIYVNVSTILHQSLYTKNNCSCSQFCSEPQLCICNFSVWLIKLIKRRSLQFLEVVQMPTSASSREMNHCCKSYWKDHQTTKLKNIELRLWETGQLKANRCNVGWLH